MNTVTFLSAGLVGIVLGSAAMACDFCPDSIVVDDQTLTCLANKLEGARGRNSPTTLIELNKCDGAKQANRGIIGAIDRQAGPTGAFVIQMDRVDCLLDVVRTTLSDQDRAFPMTLAFGDDICAGQ